MEQFRNVGIIGRLGSTRVLETVRRLKRFLLDRHLHVILEDTIADVLPGHGLQTSSRKMLGEVCDLVIVVGGDGSMLGAARALARHKVPVLGINRGSLGFLTDIRPDELELKVAQVLEGQYLTENRFLLEAEVRRQGEAIGQGDADEDGVLGHRRIGDRLQALPPRLLELLHELLHPALQVLTCLLGHPAHGVLAEDRLEQLLPDDGGAAGDADLDARESAGGGERDDHEGHGRAVHAGGRQAGARALARALLLDQAGGPGLGEPAAVEPALLERLEAARQALGPELSRNTPAPRYGLQAPGGTGTNG